MKARTEDTPQEGSVAVCQTGERGPSLQTPRLFLSVFQFSQYAFGEGLMQLLAPSLLLFSCVRLFATPWTAAHQASLSVTVSWSLLKLMSIESVMPSNHLILCHPLLPSIFPSIRDFSNDLAFPIR